MTIGLVRIAPTSSYACSVLNYIYKKGADRSHQHSFLAVLHRQHARSHVDLTSLADPRTLVVQCS